MKLFIRGGLAMYDKYVLGINYGGHDTSACILGDGNILAACEEERYCKAKHPRIFPKEAIKDMSVIHI